MQAHEALSLRFCFPNGLPLWSSQRCERHQGQTIQALPLALRQAWESASLLRCLWLLSHPFSFQKLCAAENSVIKSRDNELANYKASSRITTQGLGSPTAEVFFQLHARTFHVNKTFHHFNSLGVLIEQS